MLYKDLVEMRKVKSHGIEELLWIKADTGAFDGPLSDWASHSEKYMTYCDKFDVVVCAGGNQGMYPLLFSRMFKTVYTFEPDPLNFHCLVNNCQDDRIVKFNCALGSKNEMGQLKLGATDNTGTHEVYPSTEGIVPMLQLDNFDFQQLDLLQLDIEGYEQQALLGGREIINKFKPVISVERSNPAIVSYLAQYGYQEVDRSHADTFFKVI
jgi:FkbM family methyltransferase